MTITITSERSSLDHDFPARHTLDNLRDERLVLRAIEAYRFFYPSVSAEGIYNGAREAGIADGQGLMLLAAGPRHVVFTANSDTPYASATFDLAEMGPMVVEVPPGPFIGLVNDHHQRWVADLGLPGPDGGRGGKHLILPPDTDAFPEGYHVARSLTYKALLAVRAMPQHGDVAAALAALHTIAVYALDRPDQVLPYFEVGDRPIDTTPLRWEGNLEFWRQLHAIVQDEPVLDEFRPMYGALAALGIVKGEPFAPDDRQLHAMEIAAELALDEMRVSAFASERPERSVWPDRQWEWASLIADDPNFETPTYLDLEARDRWFYQAIIASPAMFRRSAGAGSLYWLAARDATGAYLDGGRPYRLTVPYPVPASLFWSVTAYDARTRSQVTAAQDKAVLSSLRDRLDPGHDELTLFFGPSVPDGAADRWIQTEPGTGYFLYFRIYGPEAAAFDGSWKPGDMTTW